VCYSWEMVQIQASTHQQVGLDRNMEECKGINGTKRQSPIRIDEILYLNFKGC
jgi:hypothetical protein